MEEEHKTEQFSLSLLLRLNCKIKTIPRKQVCSVYASK